MCIRDRSPLKKISGGFGFITDGDGKRLETVEQAEAGKRITVRVKDGRIGADVYKRQEQHVLSDGGEWEQLREFTGHKGGEPVREHGA